MFANQHSNYWGYLSFGLLNG